MAKTAKTIYQSARYETGFTGDQAAEKMGISTDALRDYERGFRVPHSEVVLLMIHTYETPWLGYYHLKLNDPVGREYLPEIELRDLPSALLAVQTETSHISRVMPELVEACTDGKIEHGEQGAYSLGIKEMNHMASAAFAFMFAPIKKVASARTPTAFR